MKRESGWIPSFATHVFVLVTHLRASTFHAKTAITKFLAVIRLTERHDERLSQGWESTTLECVKHTHVSNAALEQGDDFVVYAIHATTRGDQAQKVALLLTDSLQDSIRWLHDEFHVGRKCAVDQGCGVFYPRRAV